MKDKEIRKILTEYIKATNDKYRIYQEKSIGKSVCDLMLVTDKLTGFEIKSDTDNYRRLTSQVEAYNRFFDENYIVVGHTHAAHAEEKVPDFWGILCIEESKITVIRKAKKNPSVSRRFQLDILWKIELKNLLVKNGLPMYAQKEASYIADRIAEYVEYSLLRSQISEELFQRDYSIYDARDYTVKSSNEESKANNKYLEIMDTLSEDDEEITLDKWIALFTEAKKVKETKTEIYKKKEVPVVTPFDIKYTDIEVSLGAPWIDTRIINDFTDHLFGINGSSKCGCRDYSKYNCVYFEHITGHWHVDFKNDQSTPLNVTYGTSKCNGLRILEATLNLREIKVMGDNGKYSEAETLAALEKQELIKKEFKRWIWQDEDRIWMVEKAYNEMFSDFGKISYDGSKLVFPGLSKDITLYDYQKDAIARIINEKNTLLAFDVGAGKTYIMIVSSMLMREQGISRKNMFVVPNNIVGQWEKIFEDLYPKAKILTIEPKSFKPEMRPKIMKQIKTGDYDGIIIAYSCFEMIPTSKNFIVSDMNKKVDELKKGISNIYWSYGDADIRREIEYVRKTAENFLEETGSKDKDVITFDELEINSLYLDEAHNYKNIPIRTTLKNLSGINTKGSVKCQDMMYKVKCVQEQNNGRGVIFATGTPLCNSISDVYTMQMYLQPNDLKRVGLDVFDSWVKTFAEPNQVLEIDVDTSKYRMRRKFVKFFNLPELSKMFGKIAAFYAENVTEGLPVFNEYSDVKIKRNDELKEYMKALCDRTDRIRRKEINPSTDNMLKVSTDGRKAALSLNLVGKEQKYDSCSKLKNCVDNVMKIYRKYDGCSQLVFCDYSTPKAKKYNIYADLKQRLIESGVPAKEIAFIHTCKNESAKVKLYGQINSGEVRILIGSTFKLGIGTNVQSVLKAIHHLDVPWRPADMVQREGRIIRKGNTNKEILIFRYVTEGSFDAYSWQVLETKQKFISQFLSGSTYQRSISDLENNVLSYSEVKALALSDPAMKLLAEKENELRTAKLILAQEREERKRMKDEVDELEKKIKIHNERVLGMYADEIYIGKFRQNDWNAILKGIKQQTEAGKKIFDIPHTNFKASIIRKDEKEVIMLENHNNRIYEIALKNTSDEKEPDYAIRIVNFLKKFKNYKEERMREHEDNKKRRDELNGILNTPSEHEAQVEELKKEYETIRRLAEGRVEKERG